MMSNNEGDNTIRQMMQDDDNIRVLSSLIHDDDDDDHIHIMKPIVPDNDDDDNENKDIRVVAAIDFGTTFSGFAHAYKSNPSKIIVHKNWQNSIGYLKTPTILKYDESSNVMAWGYSALAEPEKSSKKKKKKNKKKQHTKTKLAERFKLHMCKMGDKEIYLPKGLKCKTAITDYLREMGKVMKDTLKNSVPNLDFYKQVLIIMTVPAEFDNQSIGVMRECALQAEIINHRNSLHLKFTTEPEAAAINCMNLLKELGVDVDKSFMVVDCGGGTVDLTTRKLLEGNKLGEKTKRKGDYCGGSFVDDEFIKFLGRKVGQSAVDLLRENNYSQYIIQEFCRRVKFPFTGRKKDFNPYNLDLEELCPVIKQYVTGSELDEMEEEEWTIELKFEDVKEMFDPVIKKILDLINDHLNENNDDISAMLLVGGFSESKYLQEEVKKKFNSRLKNKISFPESPATAIVEGAVQYGLNPKIIATRVLLWTYGTDVARKWRPGDPEERKIPGNEMMGRGDLIIEFSRFIKCGEEIPVNAAIPRIFSPGCIFQSAIAVNLETGRKHETTFKFGDLPEKNCQLCDKNSI
ncbi:unnamed protein product [Rhizophagus irregularis]|nr:unnamed protein product [Rhizophagus irregularis]